MEKETESEPIEKTPEHEFQLIDQLNLDNEIKSYLLEYIQTHYDPTILEPAETIPDAIQIIEDDIINYCKSIFPDHGTAKGLNKDIKLVPQIRKLYIPFINAKFLEKREGKEGLYPKENGEWHTHTTTNDDIAQFIASGNDVDFISILISLIEGHDSLINLLLWYGVNPNLQNIGGYTALHYAVPLYPYSPDYIGSTILLLLSYGANPNLQDNRGYTALFSSIECHNNYNCNYNYEEITAFLLHFNANPYLKNKNGETAFDLAKKQKFISFPKLVKIHSQKSLTKICLQYISANLSSFKDQLETLPIELRSQINNLQS